MGRNGEVHEPMKSHDSIVSHSSYPLTNYESGINSSLRLTGARLSAVIQLKFYKLNFAAGCGDSLHLVGVANRFRKQLAVCDKDPSLLERWTDYRVISSDLTFNFVSTSREGGLGFRLDYRGKLLYRYVDIV